MNKGMVQLALMGLAEVIARSIGLTADAVSANRVDRDRAGAAGDTATADSDAGAAAHRASLLVGAQGAEVRLPNRDDSTVFPTWFWGSTQLSVRNDGSSYGEARVQTVLGADPEWLPLSPGETKTVRRWWGAVPVRVTNNADAPLTAWTR
ncbi:hypothetical protein [Streptomyces sp. NBC_00019]|uniref:hypothetical protein n=1 Tax=Streptomyces sp. NBC_00019 TaxID=2975623 RepID=UPI00324F1AB0